MQKSYKDLNPEDVRFIDPCMGSGHILVYAFDVFMQIYEMEGYSEREAAQSILQNNLYGLDIDDRAAQLAYFAVMMKARQYDRRILTRGIEPHVYAVQESNEIDNDTVQYFCDGRKDLKAALQPVLDTMHDAKEYGSILTVPPVDFEALYARFDEVRDDINFQRDNVLNKLLPIVRSAELLSRQYHVVVTNPPYMGSSGMDSLMLKYAKEQYPDSYSDLFAIFIERCKQMVARNGYQAMITQHGWMFLSTFENLRDKMLLSDIVNMAHLGARAFDEISGEVVQTTSFVIQNCAIANYKGVYKRLLKGKSEQEKSDLFLSGNCDYLAIQNDFSKIPGTPFAYWASQTIIHAFESCDTVGKIARPRLGFATGDNDTFMREWYEPCINNIGFGFTSRESAKNSGIKWFPTNKGGYYRKWYGNIELVVDWQNDGYRIRNFKDAKGKLRSRPQNLVECFSDGVTWTVICNHSSFRFSPVGMLYNNKGPILGHRGDDDNYFYLAALNTSVAEYILQILSPTLGFESGYICNIPLMIPSNKEEVKDIAKLNVELSKEDWDSFETSWDFRINPIVEQRHTLKKVNSDSYYVEQAYQSWEYICQCRFEALKRNEEELNRIFIDIYGLQDELTPEVEDKDVTVRKADLQRDIKNLISYAVGCMFGRYSIYKEGLLFAGEPYSLQAFVDKINDQPDTVSAEEVNRAYHHEGVVVKEMFYPDEDNIIPITDEEYMNDDIVGKFCAWLTDVFGTDTLEENLQFIASALGGKGSPRAVIRSYFLNDFYTDHCRKYQKRPIYWLYDSGKQNGFKALVYMHRYDADTTGRVRVGYLHHMEKIYESEIGNMADTIEHSDSNREIAAATKRKEKLRRQLDECRSYDEKIAHLALSRIAIDLDDGVKVNYRKVQTDANGKFCEILAASKDIMGKAK